MPVCAAAVYAGVRASRKHQQAQAGKKRQDAIARHNGFMREVEKQNRISATLEKHDVSKTGSLNRGELGTMLQELAGGLAPSEEELQFVLIAADATDKKMDGEIGRSELEAAISIWKSYLESKPDIDVIFEKFDKNESGKLEPDQLKSLLTELNDDIEPTEEEVKFILDSADGAVHGVAKTGGINRTELTQAISLWYAHNDKMHAKCCMIM